MIPFHKVSTSPNEKIYLDEVYRLGKFCGDGVFGKKCEAVLKQITTGQHALVTSSCTHTLDMAMHLVAERCGDKTEVLLPSFTFSSTANCILLAGLKPVFCDIDPDTLNLSVKEIEKKISSKTAAIIPVHYAGVSCQMDEINRLAKAHGAFVVEDAAHAIGSKYKGRNIGSLSDITIFSFHETKNISCGEGGAFITEDEAFFESAMIYREKGTNRSQFIRGLVDKYTWVSKGSSPLLAEPLAAILLGQLEQLNSFNAKRKVIYDRYKSELADLEQKEILRLPVIPDYAQSNYHLFHIILKSAELRNSLLDYLRNINIHATFHYLPLHNSPQGKAIGSGNETLRYSEDLHARLLRLPLYPDLKDTEIAHITDEIHRWSRTL
jgi:dTDP-4-amino-4,6-dideoxygalactose transaminase